jgi:hypothetical protein
MPRYKPSRQSSRLRVRESESIDNFASRLTTIINQIRALGEEFEETYAVKKFLHAVPQTSFSILLQPSNNLVISRP